MKTTRQTTGILTLLVAGAMTCGCACTPDDPTTAALDAQGHATTQPGHAASEPISIGQTSAPSAPEKTEPAQKEPDFFIDEAKLPAGYPGPGPVGKVVVKHYPAARLVLNTGGAGRSPNDMFMPLFRHIERNKIPMTSPVEMTFVPIEGSPGRYRASAMAFVYPTASTGRAGADRELMVMDSAPVTVLSVGFRGDYGRSSFIKGYDQIQEFMAKNPGVYQPAGPARLMAYNSPFVPGFLKYGEVQLPVTVVSKQESQTVTSSAQPATTP